MCVCVRERERVKGGNQYRIFFLIFTLLFCHHPYRIVQGQKCVCVYLVQSTKLPRGRWRWHWQECCPSVTMYPYPKSCKYNALNTLDKWCKISFLSLQPVVVQPTSQLTSPAKALKNLPDTLKRITGGSFPVSAPEQPEYERLAQNWHPNVCYDFSLGAMKREREKKNFSQPLACSSACCPWPGSFVTTRTICCALNVRNIIFMSS